MFQKHKKVFASWSGGKDSALACYLAKKNCNAEVTSLLNMLSENGTHSRSHHLSAKVLQLQTAAMGIPMVQMKATWQHYEEEFKKALLKFKKEGIQAGVFGDIDLQEHRDWVEKVCNETSMESLLPLWHRTRESLMEEFISAGFKAIIVAVNLEFLGSEWLGRQIDAEFVEDIKRLPQVDLCGEKGEYHTFVTSGPLFKKRIEITKSRRRYKKGRWFLDILEWRIV